MTRQQEARDKEALLSEMQGRLEQLQLEAQREQRRQPQSVEQQLQQQAAADLAEAAQLLAERAAEAEAMRAWIPQQGFSADQLAAWQLWYEQLAGPAGAPPDPALLAAIKARLVPSAGLEVRCAAGGQGEASVGVGGGV